jgi:hypothetical protein
MKSKILRNLLLAVLGVFALSLTAWADTLEMRDGRLIEGKFLGGSEFHIRFLVNGKEQVFDTKDVLNLSFNATAANDSQPAVSQPPATAAPAAQPITVPAGTVILVRMIDSIDSSTNGVGDIFHASLADPLVIGDTVVAPKDADVVGRLSQAKSAGKIAGRSELRLELTGITINGQLNSIVTSDYDVAGKSRGKESAQRIGGGAVLGAVIGAIAGGGKGAAIGAGVGAAAGTGVQVFTHGEKVKVPSETLLEFKLDQPFTVAPSPSSGR